MARTAIQVMLGKKLSELNLKKASVPYFGVKESVFPFNMFPEVDPVLGPEMRSTGEVLGLAKTPGLAFYKAQNGAKQTLPTEGTVLFSIAGPSKVHAAAIAKNFEKLGFSILATAGTHKYFVEKGINAKAILKMHEGRPNIADAIENGEIQLVINTPIGKLSIHDDSYIRKTAIKNSISYVTTLAAAEATVNGIEEILHKDPEVMSLQEYHGLLE